jgi:hypothetical protein
MQIQYKIGWGLPCLLLLGLAAARPAAAAATLIGPVTPYTSFSDSPFSGLSFSYFTLIRFSTLTSGTTLTNYQGVTASAGNVDGPGGDIDSVDGGANGENGHSFFSDNGAAGITFSFSSAALGQLPTAAGIAWTDGDGPITFQAFGPTGASLGSLVDTTGLRFSSGGDGDPSNYRFFGVTDPTGISAISISNSGGGIEVDHLQYGLLSPAGVPGSAAVPEPSSLVLSLFSLPCLWALARRVRRRG